MRPLSEISRLDNLIQQCAIQILLLQGEERGLKRRIFRFRIEALFKCEFIKKCIGNFRKLREKE
jgi:hypothetical protein